MDPQIPSEYFHFDGATTLIFVVNEANAVGSFVMRSTISWNMVVELDSTTLAYNSLRMIGVVDSAGFVYK